MPNLLDPILMKPLAAIILFSLLIIGCKNAKTDSQEMTAKPWFKGNLHTHSYWSDGDEFPEVILDWYKSKGYDFVALTDHNTIADGENGSPLKRIPYIKTPSNLIWTITVMTG